MQNQFVTMGEIVNAFGVKGFVKIRTDLAPNALSLSQYPAMYLRINNQYIPYQVEKCFVDSNILNVKFVNCNDRDQALALKNTIVAIPRADFPQPEKNEYYWVDLIGLEVINKHNDYFGLVSNVFESGSGAVIEIKDNDLKKRLIPFVANYIVEVNSETKKIIVDWELDY